MNPNIWDIWDQVGLTNKYSQNIVFTQTYCFALEDVY